VRILIDALTAREGGGVTYLRQILPAFRRAAPQHEYHVLLSSRYQQTLIDELSSYATVVAVELSAGNLPRRLLFLGRDLPSLLVDGAYDVLFTVNEVGCIRPTRPHVMLARNYSIFAPLGLYPTLTARAVIALYRLTREPIARAALRRATHVAFVSDAYRRAIVERLHLDAHRTSVVHHGIDPRFAAVAAPPGAADDGGHLLSVSSIAPHKNYETLLRAYAAARPLPPLTIAGGGGESSYGESVQALSASLGLQGSVRFAGRVPYDELPALYARALAFVFPSRLETFGQPLLEAMSTGTPVVAGESAVAREVCGDAALYFDAGSERSLADALTRVTSDAELRRCLSQRGRERASTFTWDGAAERMLAILRGAAGG
jgi:glycosyltransferase involved in cell wall biosynthesis